MFLHELSKSNYFIFDFGKKEIKEQKKERESRDREADRKLKRLPDRKLKRLLGRRNN